MSKSILAVIGGGVILFLLCCGLGTAFFAGADNPDAITPVPTSSAAAVAPTQQAKTKKLPGVRDGEWLVGTDITPGRYKTAGPAGDFMCYWQIATVAGAEPGSPDFVNNDVPSGQAYVNLKKGQYFTTNRCQPWLKA